MQQVTVHNLTPAVTAVQGFGNVSARSSRSGAIDQTIFDAFYTDYLANAAKVGVAIVGAGGSFTPLAYENFAAVGTVADATRAVTVQSPGLAYALTLPAAADVPKGEVIRFLYTSGATDVSVTPAGADTLDGVATPQVINGTTPSLILVSDGVSNYTAV